jgi:polyhydroxyalkanoate synthase
MRARGSAAAAAADPAQGQAVMSPNLYAALAAARHCAAGCSDKEEIWQRGKLKLYHYRSIAKPANAVPVLIVYALVNRPYMMDLQEDRSLIRGLLSQGLDVYLIDWGYPDGADRLTTLADYIDLIRGCVDQVLDIHRLAALNILGVCQGGVLSLCLTALHPERVRNLITMVTPVDFHTSADLLSKWVRKIDVSAWVGEGNVSGDSLNQLFLSLMPFRLTHQKYMELLRGEADTARIENFMRVEQWIFDSPDQAGAAFREFVTWFYQENRLARNQLEIAGRAIDLKALKLPMLNLIGKKDHLVPPASSAALQRLAGSEDFTNLEFELGHIGMYVSGRAQREVPAAIAGWLAAR